MAANRLRRPRDGSGSFDGGGSTPPATNYYSEFTAIDTDVFAVPNQFINSAGTTIYSSQFFKNSAGTEFLTFV